LISGSLNSRCKSLARGQGSGFWILNSVLTCVLGQRVVGQCSEFWILNSVLTYMPCQRSRVIEQSSEFWILNSVLMYMPGQRWVGAPLNSEFWILSWCICRVKDGWVLLWILNSEFCPDVYAGSKMGGCSSEFWILNSVLTYMPGQRWVGGSPLTGYVFFFVDLTDSCIRV
jgi:hypothetical protein